MCIYSHYPAEHRAEGYGPTPEEAEERDIPMSQPLLDWWADIRVRYARLFEENSYDYHNNHNGGSSRHAHDRASDAGSSRSGVMHEPQRTAAQSPQLHTATTTVQPLMAPVEEWELQGRMQAAVELLQSLLSVGGADADLMEAVRLQAAGANSRMRGAADVILASLLQQHQLQAQAVATPSPEAFDQLQAASEQVARA
jgi:hypothetical protein